MPSTGLKNYLYRKAGMSERRIRRICEVSERKVYNDTVVNFQSFHTKNSSSTHHLIFGKKKSTYPSRMNGAISSIVYCPGFFQVTLSGLSFLLHTNKTYSFNHFRSNSFLCSLSNLFFWRLTNEFNRKQIPLQKSNC